METNNSEKYTSKRSIQDYLSLGYLFLLALGIARDAIYFGFLGINIMQYSNVLDVLLSPIVYMTDNIIIPIIIALMIVLGVWLGSVAPKTHKKYREKKWYKKLYNVEKLDQKYAQPFSIDNLIKFAVVMIFAFYIGTGLGGGFKSAENLREGKFKISHKLLFNDKEEIDVKIVGQNSEYVFFVVENGKQVSISPIQNNIKKIDKIVKRK